MTAPPFAERVTDGDGRPGLRLNLHWGQQAIMDCDARVVAAIAGGQSGKALAIDTPIPTPSGFVLMGDLEEGDTVFDEQGLPCRVLMTHPVMTGNPCYRVTFDDGTSVVCDAEHLWVTQTSAQRKNQARRRPVNAAWTTRRPQCQATADSSVVSTRDIAASLIDRRGESNHSVRVPTLNGRACRPVSRITFTTDMPVFRMKRKLARLPAASRPDTRRRFIVAAEPIESVPVRCITVDSPGRQYLCTEAFIPTHNTRVGPVWLHREMRRKGPMDYLVAAPSLPLFSKGAGPALQYYFESVFRFGTLKTSPVRFDFTEDGCRRLWGSVPEVMPRIIVGHADDPDSLEAMTVGAAWLDEAGMPRFKLGSYDAVQQRVAIARGRTLITSKPYAPNWLKTKVFDPWERAGGDHPEIGVVQFGSADNPAFPKEEVERARRELPVWKFRMHYLGIFERPAGLIYDCFDPGRHVVDVDHSAWAVRVGGLDFGGVNTAAVFAAQHPRSGVWLVYREYHPRRAMTAAAHAAELRRGEPRFRAWVGGSKSEGQWRSEFAQAGMPVGVPSARLSDVEVGIQRVYSMINTGRLYVHRRCERLIDELSAYSRPVDERGEPTEGIMDKESQHLADALRYLCVHLEPQERADKGFAPRVVKR
jgi:hypothetical protein